MIIILFFCSGATALIYEVLWSKYLALMFGSTMQAQTVVLAVFMGGLALGNRFLGKRADAAAEPLVWYGCLELAIGLYAFGFTWLYQLADSLFAALGAQLPLSSAALLGLKAILSVVLLLCPTILMGGTLPVLAAWLQRQYPDASRWSARFYAINSLGAVAGSFLAGFFLVRWLGMDSAVQLTALMNVLVGFAAIALSRFYQVQSLYHRPPAAPVKLESPESPTHPAAAYKPVPWWVGGVLVAFSGAVSMGLEVLSSRALSMIFGGSLQAFSIVLMAFILGIGLGSSVMASPRVKKWPRELTTFILLMLAAGLLGFYICAIEGWVTIYRYLQVGLARNATGYHWHLVFNCLLALGVLGLPAAIIGALLPLWIREGAETGENLGGYVGRLLTCNTLGCVVGTLVTGFILMPVLGLHTSYVLLALVLAVTAGFLAWHSLCFKAVTASLVLCGGLLWVVFSGGEGWRYVLSSGAFRMRETEFDRQAMIKRKQNRELLFYRDAADATVSVERSVSQRTPPGQGQLILRINGKPDASSRGDLSTQYLLAHLPMLAKPDSKDIFVLGFGSGITAGALLGHPIQSLTIAENCAAVLQAGKSFAPWNRGILTNRLANILHEDARTVLKLHPQMYDVIICEPSNPWTAGIGSVFSREFFELAAHRLKPGGIMAQWFHVYEMNDMIVAMVLRTFGAVFPHMEIWDTSSGDIVLLGSRQAWPSGPDVFSQIYARAVPKRDLTEIGLPTPDSVWARQLASQRTAFAIAGDGPLQTDGFPLLEYEAPKAFFLALQARTLVNFDERTWQSELAPPGKNQILSALSQAQCQAIFGEYSSVNLDLERHFRMRFRTNQPPEYLDVFYGNQLMPCVFRATNSLAAQWTPPPVSGAIEQRLTQAELQLKSAPDQHRQAIDTIAEVLRQFRQSPPATNLVWSPTSYAVIGARASLGRDDIKRAHDFLLLGRLEEPMADQLLYLARIFLRENPQSTPVLAPQ